MKSPKMLMMAALTILTISVFAQSNTTRSIKEIMKMEVMKTSTSPNSVANDITKYTKGAFASSLSPKEQMKMGVMKLSAGAQYANDVVTFKSATCTECLNLENLTSKEQMKMKIMGLYNCPMSADITGNMSDKCGGICHMNLTPAKGK